MDTQAYSAFADELKKIAEDAGHRALRAARAGLGNEYLVGGQLSSNDPRETNFVPKIASLSPVKAQKLDAVIGAEESRKQKYDRHKKQFHKGYRKYRDPVSAAGKGAFYGIFTSNLLTGGKANQWGWKGYRIPAAIGAGLGIADYMAQGKKGQRSKKKTASIPFSNPGTFTAGRQLNRGQQTGSFLNKIHMGDRVSPPSMGQKFKIPSNPTE